MRNTSCTGVNSGCQLLEGKAIDAALSICHPIMPDCNSTVQTYSGEVVIK